MRLRRRKHVLVGRVEWAQLVSALRLRGDREAADAVWAAPCVLDASDPRVRRALRLLAELREGAPVDPNRSPRGSQSRIAVNLAEHEARLRHLRAAREAYMRAAE